MTVYVVALGLIVFIGLLHREHLMRDGGRTYLAAGLCCMIMFILAALRSSAVGADTLQYIQIFDWVKSLPLLGVDELNKSAWWDRSGDIEITYRLYNKLVSYVCLDSQTITVANSLILCLALWRLIVNESNNSWLSAFLFYALGLFQMSLNLTPSAIASLICLGSMRYVREGRFPSFLVSVVVASIFHTSALFFIPLYFLLRVPLSKNQFYRVSLIGALIAFAGYGLIAGTLVHVVPYKYSGYLLSESVKPEQLLVLLSYVVLYFITGGFSKEESDQKKLNVDMWICALVCIAYVMSIHNTYITRFVFLLAPYLIVVYGNLLYGGHSVERIKGAAKVERAQRQGDARFIVFVVSCMVLYVMRISVNNIGTTMPYQLFF